MIYVDVSVVGEPNVVDVVDDDDDDGDDVDDDGGVEMK